MTWDLLKRRYRHPELNKLQNLQMILFWKNTYARVWVRNDTLRFNSGKSEWREGAFSAFSNSTYITF